MLAATKGMSVSKSKLVRLALEAFDPSRSPSGARHELAYPWEKMYLAALTLAGPGRLQDRLESAFLQMNRLFVPHLKETIPDDLVEDFDEVEGRLTCVEPTSDEGTIAATCNAMDDDEAVELAEKIISLHDEISRRYGGAH